MLLVVVDQLAVEDENVPVVVATPAGPVLDDQKCQLGPEEEEDWGTDLVHVGPGLGC